MTKKYLFIVVILIMIYATVLVRTARRSGPSKAIQLSTQDSRNRMGENDFNQPIPSEGTGGILESNEMQVISDINANTRLLKVLPVTTNSFDIIAGKDSTIIVYLHKESSKENRIAFYTWLTDHGYGNIDLTKLQVISE